MRQKVRRYKNPPVWANMTPLYPGTLRAVFISKLDNGAVVPYKQNVVAIVVVPNWEDLPEHSMNAYDDPLDTILEMSMEYQINFHGIVTNNDWGGIGMIDEEEDDFLGYDDGEWDETYWQEEANRTHKENLERRERERKKREEKAEGGITQ